MKTCDHKSVGVVVTDDDGRFLLLTRARPPAGRAPIAGHVDEHGSFLDAAVAEAREEAGLSLGGLHLIESGPLPNICRRPPSLPTHEGHRWVIYSASVSAGTATSFSADETRGGAWYSQEQLQALADRTVMYAATGDITEAEWGADPGLEPVWVHWMALTGYIAVTTDDLAAVREIYSRTPAV